MDTTKVYFLPAGPQRGPIRVELRIEYPPGPANMYSDLGRDDPIDTITQLRNRSANPAEMVAQIREMADQLEQAWALGVDPA